MRPNPIQSYLDENTNVVVQVYAPRKPRKSERTFPPTMGSVFNLGRKCVSLRSFGVYASRGGSSA
jgi:hypothetical protein